MKPRMSTRTSENLIAMLVADGFGKLLSRKKFPKAKIISIAEFDDLYRVTFPSIVLIKIVRQVTTYFFQVKTAFEYVSVKKIFLPSPTLPDFNPIRYFCPASKTTESQLKSNQTKEKIKPTNCI